MKIFVRHYLDILWTWTKFGEISDLLWIQALSNMCPSPMFVHIGMLYLVKNIAGQYLDKIWIWTKFGQMLDIYACQTMSKGCPLFVHCQKLYVG